MSKYNENPTSGLKIIQQVPGKLNSQGREWKSRREEQRTVERKSGKRDRQEQWAVARLELALPAVMTNRGRFREDDADGFLLLGDCCEMDVCTSVTLRRWL